MGLPSRREGLTTPEDQNFLMADQQLSAPARALSGIRHNNRAHHIRFVVIGNHLAQHGELSLTAIGLGTHIQSLPPGAPVTIKALAARFPEGEVRIATALRELEQHGYLGRYQERLPSGRVVTYTVSYNNPPALRAEVKRGDEPPDPDGDGGGHPTPPDEEPQAPEPQEAEPDPGPLPEPETAPTPETETEARSLLARLRLRDPRLVLSQRDVTRLAPAVAAWLDRGLTPSAVGATLTRSLPLTPIHSPYGLLAHRLRELIPPPIPVGPAIRPPGPDRTIHPLQCCESCGKAYRAPTRGGSCGPCTRALDPTKVA
ncbi:helix-turn-helix domain-containing protein [Streptomyces sp. BR123]|uniref:helix-turn-helix domain-containing protein n=1 Tax=Streptomyces sp. BR123 TaxID=2749828 RepID=UPI0015C45E68|nr:helix-turn-helix domain-containing protein [Streptomyces sp. BR123]NXY94772.1 helix-turn-helix domain-containing protein [Streptomyces sp. BR123]